MADRNNEIKINSANLGLNLNSQISQIKPGQVTHALNAVVTNFDGNQVSYQNEQSNEFCAEIPNGYVIIGKHNIFEKSLLILFLVNPQTGQSEIGKVENCTYSTIINALCLNFHIDFPIKKVVHKVTNCGTEIYWTDRRNQRRYLDLNDLPFKELVDDCTPEVFTEIDCNKLDLQPNFAIPNIYYKIIEDTGSLIAGTYQFAIQYANSLGEGYTNFYSITNPISIFDPNVITPDYNYNTSKAIGLLISNIDTSGIYDYYNLAVIKTINNITSVELVGTYNIRAVSQEILFTGAIVDNIRLTIDDIFAKSPIYETAGDVTSVSDVLVWSDLTTPQRKSYQKIANKIKLQWQSFKIPQDAYKNPLYTSQYKGYFRDEVYAFEFVPILKGGYQADRFHIPNRKATSFDLEAITNADALDATINEKCESDDTPQPRWRVYNTAVKTEDSTLVISKFGAENVNNPCYEGPFEAGDFAYWESTDTYPCDVEIWEDLAGAPIRHHKFPDSTISHIHDKEGNIYPLGVRINIASVLDAINNSDLTEQEKANIIGFKIVRGNRANNKSVIARGLITNVGQYERDGETYYFPNYIANDLRKDPYLGITPSNNDSGVNENIRLDAFGTDESKKRYTLHSPDTSFYQPFLGSVLKLETVEYGQTKSQAVEVRKHSRYKTLSAGSYGVAIGMGLAVGLVSTGLDGFDGSAAIAGFTLVLDIIERVIPRKNYAYQINSLNQYSDFTVVQNDGNKQRRVDLAVYLLAGMQGVGDDNIVNNYQRESSVYLRTTEVLPFPHELSGVPEDTSKWIPDEQNCSLNYKGNCTSYYATLKRFSPNQYGRIYSYESIDTGYQYQVGDNQMVQYIFGGDCFINRFGYKSKMPFFIDHRVNFPDEADVFYDILGNVAYPIFWMSTDVTDSNADARRIFESLRQILGVRANNFSCPNKNNVFYQDGKFYLFAYGIQYFYCESEVNVDARQAYNDREGDFYPRVSSDLPNDWLQEINVSIANDNTYYYNKTFSKQNKENFFTFIPENFSNEECREYFPNRAIFSERQSGAVLRNNWLVYKPAAVFNFPLNFGKLISLDGMENRVVLARFENKSLLYNALLTTNTNIGQVFVGQSIFDSNIPPIDFAETDLGYVGCQHKFLLRTEFGYVTVDSKRGQVFLIQGQQLKDISEQTTGQFFYANLPFKITESFPEIDIDNNFKGIGLHGVYDSQYNRFILTKLDYKCIDKTVVYRNGSFWKGDNLVQLTDTRYFENHCMTISYNFDIQNWVSFHSYEPKVYIGNVSGFYTSKDGRSLWQHNKNEVSFCKFYDNVEPYIIEYPYNFQAATELTTHISDFTKILKYQADGSFIETNDIYFSKSIVYNNQQCSTVELVKKPKNNLSSYMKYPKYLSDKKEVLYSKVNNEYIYHDIIDMVKDKEKPFFIRKPHSIFKQLDETNIEYKNKPFGKSPLYAKDIKVRHIYDKQDDGFKFISQFVAVHTKNSVL